MPKAPFSKYLTLFSLCWQEDLEYRLGALFWMFLRVIPLVVVFFLWRAVFAQRGVLEGYTLGMVLTYYVLGRFIEEVANSYREFRITHDIRYGELSSALLRPLPYAVRLGMTGASRQIFSLFFGLPLYAFILYLAGENFLAPASFSHLVLFFFFVGVAAFLHFFFSLLVGTFSFWSEESSALSQIKGHLISFLGGGLFPLVFLPEGLLAFLRLSPFPYLTFFPIEVYLGRATTAQALPLLLYGLFWVVLLGVLAFAFWQRGLKSYAAYGG